METKNRVNSLTQTPPPHPKIICIKKEAWQNYMFHTYTHTHISPKSLLEERPYSDSSIKCLFFRVASNVTTHYFCTEQILLLNLRSAWHSLLNICSLLHAFDCRRRLPSKNFTCYRDTATYYPLSGLFNFICRKRQSSISKTHPRINICEYLMTLQDFMEFNALS